MELLFSRGAILLTYLTLLLMLIRRAHASEECLFRPCGECEYYYKPGDQCPTHRPLSYYYCEPETNLMHQSSSAFLECNGDTLLLRECGSGTYFQENKGCTDPTLQPFMQASVSGSGRVGDVCQYNTDCLNGMYCSGGVCTCLSTYIMRESYCYEKVNPNQPGCTYDVQCEAVWPGAKCSMESAIGTCKCPESTHVARETRDGWVCVSMKDDSTGGTAPLHFVCPLPEGAGFKIALNDPAPEFNGFPVACTVGSAQTHEPVQGLHGGGACLWPSTGEYIGDTFDCMHTAPQALLSKVFPQSSYSSTADGVCCPSRAMACIQPQVTGPNPTEPRWWYNAVTGTCQQFMWDPSASASAHHSANNFKTIQHCESYCRDSCTRGSPQYSTDTTASLQQERAITSCAASTSCANDFACTAVGSQHLCCPTPASICSAKGGRNLDLTPRSTPYHPGFLVNTGKESIRFFYDPSLGRCQDFVYKGSGGNFNNFLSKHECEMFCARLQCERGSPLRIGEDAQRCHSHMHCPSSHECKMEQGVCCPRKQTICAQPLRIGDCTENVKRYWYNAKTRQCQMFEYTGCQGNDNNFATILDCQNFCKNAIPEPKCIQGQAYKDLYGNFVTCSNGQGCPQNYECYYDGNQWGCCAIKAYTCSLNSDNGVQCGAGSTYKFYYNSQAQNCESFQYNGCDGNSNNFATRESCEQYCSVGGCPNGGTPLRDHSGQITVCSSQETCPDSHECTAVLVGTSTIHRCCPTRAYMCSLPPQTGTQCSSQSVTRYYFNIVTSQCAAFQYGGCDGNHNNFLTMTQCRNFCMSNACPAGNVAYVDPNTQSPINCNEALSNSCPTGFDCTFNPLTNSHVCCGATDSGVCPDGEKAFIDTLTMTARECAINIEASCPSNYLCRFNMHKNKYYCCNHVKEKMCPSGKFLYKEPMHRNPVKCTIGKQDACPDAYSCQSYLPNAFQGFCCTISSICPDDAEYYVDETSNMPRACTTGAFVGCPSGYGCRSMASTSEGFCCRGSTSMAQRPITDGCPPGNYVWMEGGQPFNCDPFNPANAPCPEGYTCQWSTANQLYQCCGVTAPVKITRATDGCPNAQIAFRDSETIRVCTAGSSNCPQGYFCQFSSLNNQFQCCGVSAGCPDDSVGFIGMSGDPERCVVGQSTCPIGFACQRTLSGHHVCCTIKNATAIDTTTSVLEIGTTTSCGTGEALLGGVCLPLVHPQEPCTSTEQCAGGSVCVENVCSCPAGTVQTGKFCSKHADCSSAQVEVGNKCLDKVLVGELCAVSLQCPESSTCSDGECKCRKGLTERKGKCVQASTQIKVPLLICARDGARALRDKDSGRAVTCSRAQNNCPSGYECSLNNKRTQYICCSYDEEVQSTFVPTTRRGFRKNVFTRKSTTLSTTESTSTVRITSSTKSNSSSEPTEKKVATTPVPTQSCPVARTPYLVNGQPKKCMSSKCPNGYDCLYSYGRYVCCSSLPGKSPISRGRPPTMGMPDLTMGVPEGPRKIQRSECLRGDPLLFPSTNTPVLCSSVGGRMCPAGYACTPSQLTGAHICCSNKMNDTRRKRHCEGFKVLVTREIHGRILKRCERSCPFPEVPIGGVCYEMR